MTAWGRARIGALLALAPFAVMLSGQNLSGQGPVQFRLRTQEAGLNFVHTNGASPAKHLPEKHFRGATRPERAVTRTTLLVTRA